MKRSFNRLNPAALAAVGGVLCLLCSTAANAAPLQVLTNHVPAAVKTMNLKPVGALPDATRLKLAISLPVRDQAGLDKFLKDIYDPASPNYRHYLTPAQFTEKFGPTAADYAALVKFANDNGLAVTKEHPNRLLLSVEASVADIRRVFHVQIRTYNHPTEARQFYAPDGEPTLDLTVPILHISGLDNYVIPHPAGLRKVPIGNGRPLNGSGPGGTYLGSDFRNAYAPGVVLTGAGQNVALFEYDGYFTSDIVAYEQAAKLPTVNLVNVPIDGGVSTPGGGDGEVSLDIEDVIAMAPGISILFVYESPEGPPDDMLNRMATDDSSAQISSSWVFGSDPGTDPIFQEFAAQGQSFFQASGDSDAYTGPIDAPEDDPFITLVGGTTLTMLGTGTAYASEKVWNYGYQSPDLPAQGGAPQFNGYWGSGGGISTSVLIPSWQQGVSMAKNGGSTTFRNLPDVALTADNIFTISDDGQPGANVGTSCAAPLWAGFIALVNQQARAYQLPTVGFLNPTVYAIGEGSTYYSCFHDITVGNNITTLSPTNFYATIGYDLCTGWGTPTGSNLINTLASPIPTPILLVNTNMISGGNGNGIIDFDECNDLTVLLTNQGNGTATAIQGTLISTTPGVIIAQTTSAFPDLVAGGSGDCTPAFTISTEPSFVCGTPVNLTLVLKYDQGVKTNFIVLPTGRVGSPDSFTSSVAVPVPTTNYSGIFSPVVVSGLGEDSIAKITVSAYVQANYDAGIIMELISPNGTSVILTEYEGGLGSGYGTACSPIAETTFDDAATNSISTGAAPFIGSFQPLQPLSVFNLGSGTNLNGTWLLNVADEFPGDVAELECWSLNISPYICVDGGGECPGSDLFLTMSASPLTVLVTSNLVYSLTVSNAGPSDAKDVAITQTLPAGMGFVTTSNYPVNASVTGSNLNLTLGTIPVYGTATVDVVTIPELPGVETAVATVGSPGTTPNPSENTAAATVLVTLPTADLAVTMTAAPAFVLQGGPLTYTITVTNNGPYAAQGVVLNNSLPPNINFISATTTMGVVSQGAATVDIGTLDVGTNVTVTLVVSPVTTGNLTAGTQVSLSPAETDPVSFNNSASVTVTVGPSADLGVVAVAVPSVVLSGTNFNSVATVFNNGPSTATSVTFSQTIPAGASLVSSSQPGVTVTNGVITWNIPSMASGTNLVITNVLQAPTILPGVQSNLLSSDLSIFGQPGDPKPANNNFVLQALVEPPTISIVSAGVSLILPSSNNGSVNPGESVEVQFNLQNTGNISTTNLVATLLATGGVALPSGAQSYGAVPPGGAALGRYFSFTANSTNGGTVVATLQLQDGSNTNIPPVNFDFVMPNVVSFWNTNDIDIPSKQFTPQPDIGPANPYPSAIVVSNVNGFVSKVTVTISNMTHYYPSDVGMMVIGPSGHASALMVDAGLYSEMLDATVTFDPTASTPLPAEGEIVTGTYLPADYNPSFVFTNAPVTTVGTNLAGFEGISPNGTWSLYAYNAIGGYSGGISNGWGLTITSLTPINPVSDLAAGIETSTNQIILGNTVTYIFSITNNSTTNSIAAYLTNVISPGLAFVSTSFTPSMTNGQTNFYSLGSLPPGAGLTITNVVRATAAGSQTSAIYAGSGLPAGNAGNSVATAVTLVTMPYADIAAMISVVPTNPVVGTTNLVYTLTITNSGPSNATSVVGSFSLAGLNVVSAPNFATSNNGSLSFNFNTLDAGNIDAVVIAASPVNVGLLTNSWTVSTTANDTNMANNSTSAIVNVTYPLPVILAGGTTLTSQGPGINNGAINPGETVTVAFTLTNAGAGPTTNLIATLQATGGITPGSPSQQTYGVIPPAGSEALPFGFTASGPSGAAVTATLVLQDGTFTFPSVSYIFHLPVTNNYSSANGAIVIPFEGPGTPYPSRIQVGSPTPLTGLVGKVTATLNGFSHTYPHDVTVLLASPAGQELLLMSHEGGPYSVTNLTLTFDDAASQTLSENQMVSGTYLPSVVTPFIQFPGLVPPSTTEALAIFDGSNPNGYWSLYVYDDTAGNDGVISSGWSLGLTAVNTVNPASLLAAGMIHAPDPALLGDFLDYQITITNLGPSAATSVVLTDVLPAALTFSSVSVSQGGGANNNNTVTCNLGTLASNAIATATIRVVAGGVGSWVNTATVSTASTDLYLTDGVTANTVAVDEPAIAFLTAAITANGVQLMLRGQPSQDYAFQVSADLVAWTTVSSNTADLSGDLIYTDMQTNGPSRFYRAVQLPQ
jgi:uncharacterized repeat protein (TIGR01451 family)